MLYENDFWVKSVEIGFLAAGRLGVLPLYLSLPHVPEKFEIACVISVTTKTAS